MLVGDTHSFGAFDIEGRTLTGSVQWSISNSFVASLSTDGDPTITSKSTGTATLRAQIGARYAEAIITVLPGTTVPTGSVLWSAGDIPGFKSNEIKPAVPTANGPDVYEIAENAQGDRLVRALASDGRQLWMRYFRKGAGPGSLPGMPKSLIPH